MLAELGDKIKDVFDHTKSGFEISASRAETGLGRGLFFVVLLIGVGFLSFGLGRLSKHENPPPVIIYSSGKSFLEEGGSGNLHPAVSAVGAAYAAYTGEANPIPPGTTIIGTRTTRNYYYLWCNGYNRIKESNRVYFTTKQEAEGKGYRKASSCTE